MARYKWDTMHRGTLHRAKPRRPVRTVNLPDVRNT